MLNQTKPTVKLESALHGILLTQFVAAQNRCESDLSSRTELVTLSTQFLWIESLPAQHDISTNVLRLMRLKLIRFACETFLLTAEKAPSCFHSYLMHRERSGYHVSSRIIHVVRRTTKPILWQMEMFTNSSLITHSALTWIDVLKSIFTSDRSSRFV